MKSNLLNKKRLRKEPLFIQPSCDNSLGKGLFIDIQSGEVYNKTHTIYKGGLRISMAGGSS
ncbi:hypothetical protein HMPREF9429_01810 [Megasphaera micronuciformis F0359]|uniref:Uncharacterized protein n=1 Tax=Megasphaera micronuciformis F0359 TaxID=706434 RepID=E2ZEA8_9FIRM|nr:hypothetical protein HMPREF9429_01810 [Megasphaera micronuciformis F0359]